MKFYRHTLNQTLDKETISQVVPPMATGLRSTSTWPCDKDLHESGEQTKRCSRCGDVKRLEFFHKKSTRWDSRCKACVSKTKKAHYRRKNKVKSYEESYSCIVKHKVSGVVIEDFSGVLAESIRGLIDEGRI